MFPSWQPRRAPAGPGDRTRQRPRSWYPFFPYPDPFPSFTYPVTSCQSEGKGSHPQPIRKRRRHHRSLALLRRPAPGSGDAVLTPAQDSRRLTTNRDRPALRTAPHPGLALRRRAEPAGGFQGGEVGFRAHALAAASGEGRGGLLALAVTGRVFSLPRCGPLTPTPAPPKPRN